jgi:hypothetical protein
MTKGKWGKCYTIFTVGGRISLAFNSRDVGISTHIRLDGNWIDRPLHFGITRVNYYIGLF